MQTKKSNLQKFNDIFLNTTAEFFFYDVCEQIKL